MRRLGPGILVAATGVGAGDLATASFAGARLGTAILWAVIVGALVKFVLNEGLARWQLVTGTTLLEGCSLHLRRSLLWGFLGYLCIWSFFTSMALMSAAGVAAASFFASSDPQLLRILLGVAQSLVAFVLVLLGGYQVFEKVMSLCIAAMFVIVVATAALLVSDPGAVLAGLVIPRVPDFSQGGLTWTVALLGGVGGTVTVLCYGYWIKESGRSAIADIKACRLDLLCGYAMTAVFGISMVIIGAAIGPAEGKGVKLLVNISDTLASTFGDWGGIAKWAFLLGAWGAIFSSLLGVWQAVPYLFCDLWQRLQQPGSKAATGVESTSKSYRIFLVLLAFLPIAGLVGVDFRSAVRFYAVVGAAFMPMLAATLLYLNGRAKWLGAHRNSPATTILLVLVLIGFLAVAGSQVQRLFAS